MNFDDLKKAIKIFENSKLTYMEFEQDGFRVTFDKRENASAPVALPPMPQAAPVLNEVKAEEPKAEAKDYVIESYPLYFFGMPGTMKVFTDRMLSMMMTYRGQESPKNGESFHGIRNPKEGRKFIVISSCAYTGYEAVFEPLIKQYDCICGKDNYLFIPLPQLMTLIDLKNQAKIDKYLAKFKTAGTEFASTGKLSEETKELIKKPPFTVGAYKIFLGNFWEEQKR